MMVIHDVKFDTNYYQILQNSSQDPSTSSKYDFVFDALIIMLESWKFEYNSGMTNYVNSWCQIYYQRWSNIPKFESGTINILQVWLWSWCNYNHSSELKIWIQLRNDKICLFMMSNLILQTIQSFKNPVRNHQCPASMTVFLMHLYSC